MLYLFQILAGLAGMILHLFVVKLPGYKAKCIAGNIPFTIVGYFQCDWMAIVASFITVLVAVYCIDEAIAAYPVIAKFVKFFMIFIGFTGSSLLVSLLGRASTAALNIIDKKTNIADGIETPHP